MQPDGANNGKALTCDFSGTENPCWGEAVEIDLRVDGQWLRGACVCPGHRPLLDVGMYRWRLRRRPSDTGPGFLPLQVERRLNLGVLREGATITENHRWLREQGFYVFIMDLDERWRRLAMPGAFKN